MSPLPGTQVIPDGWGEHHAPTAEGRMTATVSLRHEDDREDDDFDPETGQTTPGDWPARWSGPAAVQHTSRTPDRVDAAGEPVSEPPYLVAVPRDVHVTAEGMFVDVDACPDDPQLTGRRLVVRQVVLGTQRFQRDLYCDDE